MADVFFVFSDLKFSLGRNSLFRLSSAPRERDKKREESGHKKRKKKHKLSKGEREKQETGHGARTHREGEGAENY